MRFFENMATILLVLSAVAVAAVAVKREFLSGSGPDVDPVYLEEWEDWADDGILIGAPDAPVRILEFADLQCPYCARFHEAWIEAREEWGDQVSLRFFHYPLPNHPQAEPAALAAECAHDQGRFEPFVDLAYEKQDSMGEKSWMSYAIEAGIPDTVVFRDCIKQPTLSRVRIARGREIGKEFGLTGTPTVVINGWWHKRTPYDSLSLVIGEFVEGRD